jgi:regulatory protein
MPRTITAIKAQKKNPERLNIYLDEEFAFGLSRIVAAWLQVGQTLTDEKIQHLLAEDQVEAAYQRTLRFLSIRPRTEKELERYYQKLGLDVSIQHKISDRLRSHGWINDQSFADQWVENRHIFHPLSKKALQYELSKKGVQPELIAKAVQTCDEDELAYRAACKLLPRLKENSWQEFRRKMYPYLARRGFPYDVIISVIQRLWEELQSERNISMENEVPEG